MPAMTDFVVIARLTEGKPWQSRIFDNQKIVFYRF